MVFLKIEYDFLLIKIWFFVQKLDKIKLFITRILSYDIIKYNNLQFLTSFLFFAAKVV